MVKISAISRDRREFTREHKSELMRVQRSTQPELHPFEKGREYVRALNATKLDKHFAKPFIGAFDDHMDGVQCMAKTSATITSVLSGAADGEVIRWDLAAQRAAWSAKAHASFVRVHVDSYSAAVLRAI